jgi:hypothetical protein
LIGSRSLVSRLPPETVGHDRLKDDGSILQYLITAMLTGAVQVARSTTCLAFLVAGAAIASVCFVQSWRQNVIACCSPDLVAQCLILLGSKPDRAPDIQSVASSPRIYLQSSFVCPFELTVGI